MSGDFTVTQGDSHFEGFPWSASCTSATSTPEPASQIEMPQLTLFQHLVFSEIGASTNAKMGTETGLVAFAGRSTARRCDQTRDRVDPVGFGSSCLKTWFTQRLILSRVWLWVLFWTSELWKTQLWNYSSKWRVWSLILALICLIYVGVLLMPSQHLTSCRNLEGRALKTLPDLPLSLTKWSFLKAVHCPTQWFHRAAKSPKPINPAGCGPSALWPFGVVSLALRECVCHTLRFAPPTVSAYVQGAYADTEAYAHQAFA
jgi:hypothetical protein